MNELLVRVSRKTREAEDVYSYELTSLDNAPLPAFTAGSHIDVHVADGLVRQYSLCNDPRETHRYLIAVLRDPSSRGGSRALHDGVAVGEVVRISLPRNHFELSTAPRSLLLAGGIGVTPILCMAEELAAAGRPFEMHYCVKSPERAALLPRMEAAAFANDVVVHFDSGASAQRLNIAEILSRQTTDTDLYVCGPGGFIKHVIDAAKQAGWSDERVHREFFASEVALSGDADAAFDVRLASTGTVYRVPSGRSILDVLLEHGIDVDASCEAGVCGTCLTRVLEGVPEHRDVYMTDAEHAANTQMTLCCSRSKTPLLVLDL